MTTDSRRTVTDHGLGKHLWVTGLDSLLVVAKGAFIEEIAYAFIQCFVKCSIMALLWRLFHPVGIKRKIYVVGTAVIIWALLYVCLP